MYWLIKKLVLHEVLHKRYKFTSPTLQMTFLISTILQIPLHIFYQNNETPENTNGTQYDFLYCILYE